MIRQLIITLVLGVFLIPSTSAAQLWPHIKTFGYDYGYPREAANVTFVGAHHDLIIGSGEWQTKKISVFQYDTIKAANADAKIMPYTVIQAFTFEVMTDFFNEWIEANYDSSVWVATKESLYIHYYDDQIVKMRAQGVKTSGTGTPFDQICDSSGNLLTDGASGNYYISLGYGGGTASTLAEAKTYQYWNSGFEPRMNHQSAAWKGAYLAYIKDVVTVDASAGKYANGVYLDTYTGVVDAEGHLPNINNLIEIRAVDSFDVPSAQQYLSEYIADMLQDTAVAIETDLGIVDFMFIVNGGDMGYMHGSYEDVCADFKNAVLKGALALEYITSQSKIRDSLYPTWIEHINLCEEYTCIDHMDLAWYGFGQNDPPKPGIGARQFMYGVILLFNHPDAYYGIHYYTAAKYGPGVYPNIGEHKGGEFKDSHWDTDMEYDMGVPVVSGNTDYWGGVGTTYPYVIDPIRDGYWADGHVYPGRTVWRRKYSKGLVILIGESTDSNLPLNPDYLQLGGDPVEYDLGGDYCRIRNGQPDNIIVGSVTLGAGEAAVMTDAVFCTGIAPVCNFNEVQDGAFETGVDCGGGICPECEVTVEECNFNGVQDGPLETDVDCGGGICPDCTEPIPDVTILTGNATYNGVPLKFVNTPIVPPVIPVTYNVWLDNSLTKYRQDGEDGTDGDTSLTLEMPKNSISSFQVMVYAGEGSLTDVDVEVSNLTKGADEITDLYIYKQIYGDYINQSRVEYPLGSYPDALLPKVDRYYNETRNTFPFNVSEDKVQGIWIDVGTTSATPAGTYTGTVTVSADGETDIERSISVEVRNFALPSTSTFHSQFVFRESYATDAHGLGQAAAWAGDQAAIDLSQLYLKMFLYHRMGVILSGGFSMVAPSQMPWNDTTKVFSVASWEPWEEIVTPSFDGTAITSGPFAGAKQPLKRVPSEFPADAVSRTDIAPADKETAMRQYVQEVYDKFEAEGWDPWNSLIFGTKDEPRCSTDPNDFVVWRGVSQDYCSIVIDQAQDINAINTGGLGTFQRVYTNSRIREGLETFGDYGFYSTNAYTFVCPGWDKACTLGGTRVTRDQYTQDEVWGYLACDMNGCWVTGGEWMSGQIDWSADASSLYNRLPGFIWNKYDLTGTIYWGTVVVDHDSGGDPYASIWSWGSNGDGHLVYPGVADDTGDTIAANTPVIGGTHDIPIESIRLKHIRDAIQDWEVIQLAKAASTVAEVEVITDGVFTETDEADAYWNLTTDPSDILDAMSSLGDLITGE